MREKVVLKFDSPYCPKIESYRDFFQSLFLQQYKQACESVKNIIDTSKEVLKNDDVSNFVYNIIPFVGDRGSGKTSVMLSFFKYLKDYGSQDNTSNSDFDLGNNNFICINPIDAGHLELNENLFGIVLARMLAYYNEAIKKKTEFNNTYNKASIYRQFSDIYANFMNINEIGSHRELAGKSPILVLEELDASQNLRSSFISLVNSFIQAIAEIDTNVSIGNAKVVIAIDDVDMNLNNTHKMLEQIQTYMMIPNVIILITASYDNLVCVCQNQYALFFKEVIHAAAHAKTLLDRRFIESCDDLAHEYLNKLFPTGKMVHLRQQRDCELYVLLDSTDDKLRDDILFDKESIKTNADKFDVIERDGELCYRYTSFVSSLITQGTGICVYPHSEIGCILEPSSIRAKGQYIHKMKQLVGANKNEAFERITVTAENTLVNEFERNLLDRCRKLRLLHEDITVRHIGTFSETQRRKLSQIAGSELSHLSANIYLAILNMHKIHGTLEQMPKTYDHSDRNVYDFSHVVDLLDSLNKIGDEDCSQFVYTVFLMFTSMLEIEKNYRLQNKLDTFKKHALSREGESYTFCLSDTVAEIEYDLAREYIGSSLFSWFDNQLTRSVLYSKMINEGGRYKREDLLNREYVRADVFGSKVNIGFKNKLNINIEPVQSINIIQGGMFSKERIHVFAVFLMFLSSQDYEINILYNKSSKVDGTETNKGIVKISFNSEVDFSISSFFINICKPQIIMEFYIKLLEAIIKNGNINDREIMTILQEADKIMTKLFNSVSVVFPKRNKEIATIAEAAIKTWKENFSIKSSVVPILNMELMYNLARKVRSYKRKNEYILSPWQEICEYFYRFGEELKKIDEYYSCTIINRDCNTYHCGLRLYEKYKGMVPICDKYIDKKSVNNESVFYLDSKEELYFNKIMSQYNWINNMES